MTSKLKRIALGKIGLGALLVASLAACGGGGGSAGTTTGVGSGTATGTKSGTIAAAVLTVSVVDGAGATITALSGGDVGTVRAKFVDATGAALANAVVQFTVGSATLLQFSPISGSALTDSTGVAVINVKPVDFSSAGATTITAQAVLGAKTASGTTNVSIGAANLLVGALSFTPSPSGPLSSLSTTTLNIPVTNNGQPVSIVPGLNLSSLCSGDGTAVLTLGSVVSGNATATYLNKGCTRGTDVITASIGNSSKTISIGVNVASAGAINFVSSSSPLSSLVLKGSGGLGRSESAQLTFKVVDQTGAGIPGVNVSFAATTTTGGLKVLPAQATTDSQGNVTTSVQSGTIPTPVKVIAQASTANGSTVSVLSDNLTISTGLPIQKAMSVSANKYNIEGLDYDGVSALITVRMADQYGNPIASGTTVNFIAEGGAVGSSAQGACQTDASGLCSVSLFSQSFRPANGRVTVLAYAQGIEDFIDSNGDGQYSCSNFTSGDSTSPAVFRPLIDTCISGGEPFTDLPDAFLDAGVLTKINGVTGTGGLDGVYDAANGDLPVPYNKSTYSAAGDGRWGINYIRQSREFIFSGSHATLIRQFCTSTSCRDWNPTTDGSAASVIAGLAGPGCSAQTLVFRLTDINNNPIPAESTLSAADANKISAGTFYPAIVPSTNEVGGTFHQVTIKPDTTCASGSVNIVATTPKLIGSVFGFSSN
ncbi:Ig-like domain-containing protein [Actimicrobium sp. CCC2.4]|uniref:Ig-like domain-containing protein n=1 Tax=Actimicrobium sp. CCC2.4 TaxID=3048606 RepID=UPI002AC95CF8|nr:Ig-like domain-containing protein [Actimicrobium sp. CCC2.4]MEB0135471.1 Ig-like domain-containing protein [Actimicrobium sp. CCC2.4]WPX32356.1 Ig-like domain-containing protein [Actimicrobium sp. CCC2.4]